MLLKLVLLVTIFNVQLTLQQVANPCAAMSSRNYFPFPTDRTKYIQCTHGSMFVRNCPVPLVWNNDLLHCEHAELSQNTGRLVSFRTMANGQLITQQQQQQQVQPAGQQVSLNRRPDQMMRSSGVQQIVPVQPVTTHAPVTPVAQQQRPFVRVVQPVQPVKPAQPVQSVQPIDQSRVQRPQLPPTTTTTAPVQQRVVQRPQPQQRIIENPTKPQQPMRPVEKPILEKSLPQLPSNGKFDHSMIESSLQSLANLNPSTGDFSSRLPKLQTEGQGGSGAMQRPLPSTNMMPQQQPVSRIPSQILLVHSCRTVRCPMGHDCVTKDDCLDCNPRCNPKMNSDESRLVPISCSMVTCPAGFTCSLDEQQTTVRCVM